MESIHPRPLRKQQRSVHIGCYDRLGSRCHYNSLANARSLGSATSQLQEAGPDGDFQLRFHVSPSALYHQMKLLDVLTLVQHHCHHCRSNQVHARA